MNTQPTNETQRPATTTQTESEFQRFERILNEFFASTGL